MANLGFQLTGSGVKDCAGCGEHVMTSDLSKPAYCGDGSCDVESALETERDRFIYRNATY
jgi:hypothetical protein